MRSLHLVVVCCFTGLLCGGPVFAEGESRAIELTQFNSTYRDLASNLAPIRQGGLEVHISSPRHRLTIYGNRVEVTPTGRGTFAFTFEADFDGEGDLIADLVAPGGSSTRFTDQVSARRQRSRVVGEVRVESHEGGFLITVVEPGPAGQVVIESGMVRQVVGLCGVFSLLPLMHLDCEGLGESMGRIRVPQPEVGAQFVLSAESLTEDERGFFERLVNTP